MADRVVNPGTYAKGRGFWPGWRCNMRLGVAITPARRVPPYEQISAARPKNPCQEYMPMIRPALLSVALAAVMLGPLPAAAQSSFAPKVIVNDRAITNYEWLQRVRMLQLFRTPGDVQDLALQALIDDRIYQDSAARLGVTVSADEIKAGMEEFAARANLTAEQFLQALSEAGVSAETFRDFVSSGLLWRGVIRAKFVGTVTVSDADIDRALERLEAAPNVRVLISEIVIATRPGSEGAAMGVARRLKKGIDSEASFAAAARANSTAASASAGGRLGWMSAADLPESAIPTVIRLAAGQVSDPMLVNGAVTMYYMRELQQTPAGPEAANRVEYAQLFLPAGSANEAGAIRARLDNCDDLYTAAKGLPEDQLIRETRPVSQVPAGIAAQVAQLDANESTDFAMGSNHVVLMVCTRNPFGAVKPSRENIRGQLLNQRLAGLAEVYLEELRQAAFVREP